MNATQYGRYRIVSELGKGAMGIVYQAHDPQIDRMVALKVLRQDRVIDQGFVRRFLAEARVIGRLSHPNIVTVFDVGEDHGTIYIAMEFLEGRSLDMLIREQTFGSEKIVDLGIQVANALDYAHRQGIIHRDIKPGNIIITPQGHVKVTDFGIAHIEGTSDHQMTQMGEILGTPIYMAPEQVAGQPVDGRSDIYSLGVVLYELATGKRPFAGDNLATLFNAIAKEQPRTVSQLNPKIPSAFSELIMKCLSKSPVERFQNGQSLSQALKGCLANRPGLATPLSQIPKKRRNGMYVLSGVAVIVLVGVLTFFFISDRTPPQKPIASNTTKIPAESLKIPDAEKRKPSQIILPKEKPIEQEPVSKLDEKSLKEEPTLKMPSGKPKPLQITSTQKIDTPSPTPKFEPRKRIPIVDHQTEQKPQRSTLDIQTTPKELSPSSTGKDDKNDIPRESTPRKPSEGVKPVQIPATSETASTSPTPAKAEPQKTIAAVDHKPEQKSEPSTLNIQSVPEGAGFYLNGKFKGTTPYKVNLPYGKYEVRVEYENYYDWEAQVNLDKPGETPLRIRLIPKD